MLIWCLKSQHSLAEFIDSKRTWSVIDTACNIVDAVDQSAVSYLDITFSPSLVNLQQTDEVAVLQLV